MTDHWLNINTPWECAQKLVERRFSLCVPSMNHPLITPAKVEESIELTTMNTQCLRYASKFSMEPSYKDLEAHDICFVFDSSPDDTIMSQKVVTDLVLEMFSKRKPPLNSCDAAIIINDKTSLLYISELYKIEDTIDHCQEGITTYEFKKIIRDNFLRTLRKFIPSNIVIDEVDHMMFVKVRIMESTARLIASEIEYLLQMDKRAVSYSEDFDVDERDLVPPYCSFKKQYESIESLSCIRNASMMWTRYDKLSRPILLETFDKDSAELSIFRDVDRVRLLMRALKRFYNFPKMHDSGVLLGVFTLHQPHNLQRLTEQWARFSHVLKSQQPLKDVRDYFGEEIGLYFAWLGFYTRALRLPAILGCSLYILQTVRDPHLIFDDIWVRLATLSFAAFLIGWSSYFFYGWLRIEKMHSLTWGLEAHNSTENDRTEFVADSYVKCPVQPSRWILTYAKSKLNIRSFASNLVTLSLTIICVICCNQTVHELIIGKLNVSDDTESMLQPYLGPLAESMSLSAWATSILVKLFDLLFIRSVKCLVNFENHQFEKAYKESLSMKLFFFKALDYFTPLVYLAFFKNQFISGEGGSAVGELRSQLISLFAVDFASNVVEIGIPLLQYYLNRMKHAESAVQDTARAQMDLVEYEDTIEDYQEMVVQLGLVSLFSTVCPIIPMLAWASNHAEIRVDALKLVKCHRRPFPEEAMNIGPWNNIIRTLTVLSAITNISIVVFVCLGKQFTVTYQLTACIIFLAMMFFVKEAVQYAWTDDTDRTRELRTRMSIASHEAFWGQS